MKLKYFDNPRVFRNIMSEQYDEFIAEMYKLDDTEFKIVACLVSMILTEKDDINDLKGITFQWNNRYDKDYTRNVKLKMRYRRK